MTYTIVLQLSQSQPDQSDLHDYLESDSVLLPQNNGVEA
jgi:hypothetical protein